TRDISAVSSGAINTRPPSGIATPTRASTSTRTNPLVRMPCRSVVCRLQIIHRRKNARFHHRENICPDEVFNLLRTADFQPELLPDDERKGEERAAQAVIGDERGGFVQHGSFQRQPESVPVCHFLHF